MRHTASRWTRLGTGVVGSILATSCATPPSHPAAPPLAALPKPMPATVVSAVDEFGKPPLAPYAPDAAFPAISHAQLSNGLELRVVTRKAYPLLEIRLVVLSGTATDGAPTGVSALTGELLKVGGAGAWSGPQLIERAESLGSSLDIVTDRDSTQISMDVTTADFERSLELMGALVHTPRFSEPEFKKLQQRELERSKNQATANAEWAGSMVLYRELFRTPRGTHPYAHLDATSAELQQVTLSDCKAWYHSHVTPHNAMLVIVGDVDVAAARAAAERWFIGWQGPRPAAPVFEAPAPADRATVWIVDRPRSEQSQIYVAGFGPDATSPVWPAAETANQILGGGVAGRLFLDVREKRSLAYHTGSRLVEVAHGRAPMVLSAGTQTAKTDEAVQALLDNLKRLESAPPTPAEVRDATRNLATSLLFRTETVGAMATLVAEAALLGRQDRYYDDFRRALKEEDARQVAEVAQDSFAFKPPLIVVAGDASRLEKPLARFGNVKLVEPGRDFAEAESSGSVGPGSRPAREL